MPNTLEDLRAQLFATLDALRDKDNPMPIERARAISEVADTVIKSAIAEVGYVKATGRNDLSLPVFDVKEGPKQLPSGVVGITTHRTK